MTITPEEFKVNPDGDDFLNIRLSRAAAEVLKAIVDDSLTAEETARYNPIFANDQKYQNSLADTELIQRALAAQGIEAPADEDTANVDPFDLFFR